MNTVSNKSFSAFIGIDWADAKHDVCVQAAGDERREFSCMPHKVEAIDNWAQSLYRRFGGQMAVALELSKGPLVYALQKYDFFVIFPVNPSTLAKYREAFTPSGAKDDPSDAELALDLILRHADRFTPLNPQSVEMRTLVSLVEQRRRLVNDRVRITNRLRNTLKQYYPQALEWFDRIDTLLFCDFIERWPTLLQVKRARRTTVQSFFYQHNMRSAGVLDARLNSIKSATPLTLDKAVITPNRLQALVLVDLLRATLAAIKRFDLEIAELVLLQCIHPDYVLFDATPKCHRFICPPKRRYWLTVPSCRWPQLCGGIQENSRRSSPAACTQTSCLASAQSIPMNALKDLLLTVFMRCLRSDTLATGTCVPEFCESNIGEPVHGKP